MSAFIFRYVGSYWHNHKVKMMSFESLVPRQPKTNSCIRHPKACFYDGPTCPACQAEREWLALSEEKK